MKAIAYYHSLPTSDAAALQDIGLPAPTFLEHDLLVRVTAIAVNPVDALIRRTRQPEGGKPEVLGWDAVGVVEAVGAAVQGFAPGQRVYYAGAINRPGANSELHAVDARIAAHAPASLGDADAAALPLTSITAYELLFDRLRVPHGGGAGQTLLVTGGAGGVGSILIQLARTLTQLRVVVTASRPQSRQWCLDLGAHAVIDHHQPFGPQLQALGIDGVEYVASLTHTLEHFDQIVDSLNPQGQLAVIDDMSGMDISQLKWKSISLHSELMFTRSLFQTPDMAEQGRLLGEVAQLVDEGRIRTTAGEHYGNISAANLLRAHQTLESGTAVGKITLAGF